ncbi:MULTISPECIES: pilus assembly protein PilM [Methylomonas]|uniref:pilus assembly protein PilM n=1 Tax=Methylomonas TaxID=416 RepID=UPI00068B8212|nr:MULTISPECIES: pilus assembly protein PilM [Methylomonas]
MQKLLRQTSNSPGVVAVSFVANGFTIAITRYAEHERPRLLHAEFVPASEAQWVPLLHALVKNHDLEEYDCHILLAPEHYRAISIEAPAVNAEEIKQAVGWRIADLLDYPIDQATIDYYLLPKSNRPNTPQMLEAVACTNEVVRTFSERCRQAGLHVKVIDIQETALRNLATLLPENQQGIALLHLEKDHGRVIIQKNGALYLSRKIGSGYQQLADSTFYSGLEPDIIEHDSLALEIQRSFDYVENFFDIPPITSLAVVLMPIDTQKIINFLTMSHGITARAMDLSAIVDSDILLSDATQSLCAPVIGASLRRALESGQ